MKTILGRTSDLTGPQYYKQGDWNQVEIIARGNTLIHMLNGQLEGPAREPVYRRANRESASPK